MKETLRFFVMVGAMLLVASPVTSKDTAPDFNLRSPEGKRLQLKTMLESGPVLVDFWATWCKPCIKAMPKLQEIHEKYKSRGLTVVGVNEDGPRGQSKVKPFLRARKLTFPIALDLDGSVMKRMRATAYPTTILIAQDGEVVFRQAGYDKAREQDLVDAIEALLPAGEAEGSGTE